MSLENQHGKHENRGNTVQNGLLYDFPIGNILYFYTFINTIGFILRFTYYSVLYILLLGHLACKSQKEKDLDSAQNYLDEVLELNEQEEYGKCIVLLEQAKAVFQAHEEWDLLIHTHNRLSSQYIDLNQFDSTLFILQKALQLHAKLDKPTQVSATTLDYLGILYGKLERYDSSLYYLKKGLKQRKELLGSQHIDVAESYQGLGWYYGRKKDFSTALEYLEKALEIRVNRLEKDDIYLGECYYNMAHNYNQLGESEKALSYYYKTLDLWEGQLPSDHFGMYMIYNSLGSHYKETGEVAKAIPWFKKVIDKAETEEDLLHLASAIGALGDCNFYAGEGEVLSYYRRSLRIKKDIYGKSHSTIARDYLKIGQFYQKTNSDSAYFYLKKSKDIYRSLFGKRSKHTSKAERQLALLYQAQKENEKALAHAQASLLSLCDTTVSIGLYELPSLSQLRASSALCDRLRLKGDVLLSFENIRCDIAALGSFRLAAEVVEKVRSNYISETSKLFLSKSTSEIYEKGINTAMHLYRTTGDKRYWEEAFYFAEQNRANILLSSLIDTKAKKFAGIPAAVLQKERALKVDLVFYQTMLYKEKSKRKKDVRKIKLYNNKLFHLQREYEAFIRELESKNPKYFNLKQQKVSISLSKIQSKLKKRELLVEYFLGERFITLFAVGPSKINVLHRPLPEKFDQRMKRFMKAINTYDKHSFPTWSYGLYKELLAPIENELNNASKLIVVPHGALSEIPFEALMAKLPDESNDVDYTTLPFLIKKVNVEYHYSSTLLQSALHKATYSKGLIAFAPFSDTQEGNRTLPKLPESKEEVTEIVALLGAKGIKSQLYMGEKATKEAFASSVDSFRFIHLATHTLWDKSNPNFSKVYFAQGEMDSETDNELFLSETYNLQLNPELLVLSSCESGQGMISKGEGLLSLTRGFYYSGAQNIICSLWKVNDHYSKEIMIGFYGHLIATEDIATSLGRAKRTFLKDRSLAFPKNWAGFVHIAS